MVPFFRRFDLVFMYISVLVIAKPTTSFQARSNTFIRTFNYKATSSLPKYANPVIALKMSELPNPIDFLAKSSLSDRSNDLLVGEDAGIFDVSKEEWGALGERGWLTFSAAVGTILTAVALLWVYSPTGYGDDFLAFLEQISGGNSHVVTLLFGIIFPLTHSGLASLRPFGEKIVGARTWRVIFAFPSLCLSYSWITYFISHAHDGWVFWDLSNFGAAHAVAWMLNFASFLFLYPTVFNLKEVAAVEVPKIHLWETGIIRITRHPQYTRLRCWGFLKFYITYGTNLMER